MVDDRDAGAHLAELGEDVAADEDRLAHRTQLAEDLAHLDACARVETRCRLVEDQQGRVMDERVREAQPLAHAARERLDVRLALVRETDDLEQLADHRRSPGGGDAVAAGEEVEVLPDAKVVVDAVEVGHVADAASNLDGVGGDGDAGDERLTRRRSEQRGQDLHRRRLAGPVRADEAEDLAVADDEVEARDGELVVVALHEAAGLDDGDADHRSSTPATCALGIDAALAHVRVVRDAGHSDDDPPRRAQHGRWIVDLEPALLGQVAELGPRSTRRVADLDGESLGPEAAEPTGVAEDEGRIRPDDDLDLGRDDPGRLERKGDAPRRRALAEGHHPAARRSSHRPRSRSRRRPSDAGGS